MRIAIVADIHGNRMAFEAVLADLREMSPDFVLHAAILPTADQAQWTSWTGFATLAGRGGQHRSDAFPPRLAR